MKRFFNKIYINLVFTFFIIGIIAILSVSVYKNMMNTEEKKCWQTLEDSAQVINEEIVVRLEGNLNIMKLVAGAMVQENRVNSHDVIISHINEFQQMTIFNRIDVLYPDEKLLLQTGKMIDVSNMVSFEELAALGEHMSDRTVDIETKKSVIYYYVPVIRNNEVLAILVGVIDCKELSNIFKVEPYNGQAICCIVDYSDGNFIMDDWHSELGNIFEMKERKKLKRYEDVDLVDDIKNAKTGAIAYVSKKNGENSYMYYTPVGIFDWELLIIVQENVAFGSMLELKDTLTMVASVEAVALLVYLLWTLYMIHIHMNMLVKV